MISKRGMSQNTDAFNNRNYLTFVKRAATMYADTEAKVRPQNGSIRGPKSNLGNRTVKLEPVVVAEKTCKFFLLGPFAITNLENEVITPKSKKTCAMLAMLILSPRATRTRVWLRDKLWSDRGEEQGAASLRQALLDARRSLGPIASQLIISDKKSISLKIDQVQLDTESLISSVKDSNFSESSLKRAMNEHLLEGMDIRDPEFEDWLTLERQIWERRVGQQFNKNSSLVPLPETQENTERPLKLDQIQNGQKVMTTVVAVQCSYGETTVSEEGEDDSPLFDQFVARMRDISNGIGGRIYEVKNSHVMMEFERPIDALRFAISLRLRLSKLLSQSTDSKLAVGINSGVVYRENNRVFGTESDIAIQACGVAPDNSIMITEASCALFQGRTDFQFSFEKEVTVDKFPRPIKLFRVTDSTTQSTDAARGLTQPSKIELNDSGGPSIGVLPFRTSDSSVDEYMGEGLADDVIVALSKNHWLNVISRNSSFSYESGLVPSSAIAKDLNVDYLVSGVVKISNSVISIVITLESAVSSQIIWSEPFSVQLDDIMQLQELVASKITAHLLQELGKHEQVRAYESRIDDLTTWQLVHRGHWHMTRRTAIGVEHAKQLYERALQRNPFQSDALLALAWWHFWKAWSEHGTEQAKNALKESKNLCRKALLMDPSDARTHAYLGAISIMCQEPATSLGFFSEAIRLNPSLSFAYSLRGSANLLLGTPELCASDIKNALSLNPADYYRFHTLSELASAYFFSSELDKSIQAAENSSFLAPRYWYARLIKIACLIERNAPGDDKKAEQEKIEIVSRKVNISEKNIHAIPFINRQYNTILINAYKQV